MQAIRQCFYPGQRNARHHRAGTQVVAIDGVLRLTYRDPALDWLLTLTSPISIEIDEGGCHVLPYDTFVEIEAVGSAAVNGIVSVPGRRNAFIAAIGKGIAWVGSSVRADDQRSGERKTPG
ncbi:hypothetical protein [Caballeronia sordidicola]|jgi:hypothetical protein|uniref:hypothetical protein n=1 Tax=Caballeronia sordidicola TaxID=196367 RepID=UPI000B78EA65|nr:hypothetical protein [Caballeronia sordidicola]